MEDAKITHSASWIALMLTYLLGDVLRIYSSDFKPRETGGMKISQDQWLMALLPFTEKKDPAPVLV